jgi:hypothetical protein
MSVPVDIPVAPKPFPPAGRKVRNLSGWDWSGLIGVAGPVMALGCSLPLLILLQLMWLVLGTRLDGVVVGAREEPHWTPPGYVLFFEYRAAGEVRKGMQLVSKEEYQHFEKMPRESKEGRAVSVWYLGSGKFYYAQLLEYGDGWWFMVWMVLGEAVVVVMWWKFICGVSAAYHLKRAYSHGMAVPGEVVGKQKRGWWGKSYWVEYRFTKQGAKSAIQGKVRVGSQVWEQVEEGQEVTVVYSGEVSDAHVPYEFGGYEVVGARRAEMPESEVRSATHAGLLEIPRRLVAREPASPRVPIWVFGVFVSIGLVLCWMGFVRLMWHGYGTQYAGVVTGTKETHASRNSPIFTVHYQFEVDGKSRSGHAVISRIVYESLGAVEKLPLEQRRVNVWCITLGPSSMVGIPAYDNSRENTVMFLIFVFVFHSVVWSFGLAFSVKPAIDHYLYQRGAVATGRLAGKRNFDESYYVDYSFVEPLTGRVRWSTVTVGKRIWEQVEKGQALTVLYSVRWPWMNVAYELGAYELAP